MPVEIKIPSPGESITQAIIASWLYSSGSVVDKDSEIAEIESDKATLAVYSPVKGILHIIQPEGSTLDVGTLIATIEPIAGENPSEPSTSEKDSKPASIPAEKNASPGLKISPLAKSLMIESGISPAEIEHTGSNRILKKHVISLLSDKNTAATPAEKTQDGRTINRKKMSPLRVKLAQRLVAVRQQTAMLTTFNEVDMSQLLELRKGVTEAFVAKTGHKPGLVSFFAKAVTLALLENPAINAKIDGEDIVYHDFVDLNIAVSSPKGLITPVLKNAHQKSTPETELSIRQYADKAARNRIGLADLETGTFTITNGGVFGSMMSTPIINPPQSAILGMHKIIERPVVRNGQMVIAPMMYIALSYDHRLIDGKESVGFVVRVKELLETALDRQNPMQYSTEFQNFLSEKS